MPNATYEHFVLIDAQRNVLYHSEVKGQVTFVNVFESLILRLHLFNQNTEKLQYCEKEIF